MDNKSIYSRILQRILEMIGGEEAMLLSLYWTKLFHCIKDGIKNKRRLIFGPKAYPCLPGILYLIVS